MAEREEPVAEQATAENNNNQLNWTIIIIIIITIIITIIIIIKIIIIIIVIIIIIILVDAGPYFIQYFISIITLCMAVYFFKLIADYLFFRITNNSRCSPFVILN